MAELSRQFFLHKFLNTLAMCFLAPVAEEIIFRGFLLNSSIGWGRYSRVSGIIITSLAFAFMHTQYLFAVTFVYLFVFFIDIMRCSNEKSWANDTDNTSYFK